MKLPKLFSLCLLGALPIGAQNTKPCDASARFVDKNMIDYTIKVKALRGSIIDSTGAPIYEGCIAVFANDRSKLLRTVEADSNGNFEIKHVKSGDYWLVIQDGQRAFCPAATHVRLRWYARKAKIAVHMEPGAIDRCSYSEAR